MISQILFIIISFILYFATLDIQSKLVFKKGKPDPGTMLLSILIGFTILTSGFIILYNWLVL